MNTEQRTEAGNALLAALEKIVAEVAGPSKPFSSDSWLPDHFIAQAQAAIAKAKG